eukprot:237009_1
MATEANNKSEKPIIETINDSKQEESKTNLQTNDFLTPLKLLIDNRTVNLFINIISKIIQDPKDERRQDLNYETIKKKIGDFKPAFDVLYSIGFKEYISTDSKNEKRLKIEITDKKLKFLDYVLDELLYKYSDRSRTYRHQFDCKDLMKSHPPDFKDGAKQLIYKTICPNRHNDCFGTMIYGRHKLIELPATIPDPTYFIKNSLRIESNIYEYISNINNKNEIHFYVNFADHNLFGYYRGSLFAQDEIMTTEHPILGSLREKLIQSYHSCKDKTKLIPKCDGSVIILNAIKHGHFNQENLNKIYGNRFRMSSNETILNCLEICSPPIIDNIICIASIMGRNSKYKKQQIERIIQTAYCGFNGAKCESMYQILKRIRNPNNACSISECNQNELLWILTNYILKDGKLLQSKDIFLKYFTENKINGKQILEMSRKDFGAAIVKYGNNNKKLNGPAMKLYRTLKDYGDLSEIKIFDGYTIDNDNDDEKKQVELKMKKLVIHTGNWGCGAFGGNVELHAILQIIAAVSAGIDEMSYHAVNDKAMEQVFVGCDVLLNEIIPNCKDNKGKIKRDLLIDALVRKGYHWGTPNGT